MLDRFTNAFLMYAKFLLATVLATTLLTGCGSSSDDDDDFTPLVAGPSGSGMLGIIRNAVVTITGIDGVNTVLGTGTTDANGQYGPIMIPANYSGPLRVTISPADDGSSTFLCDFQEGCPLANGGNADFGDEVPFDLSLEAIAPSQEALIINVSPFTHSATVRVDQLGGLSVTNVNQANQEMANLLGRLLRQINANSDATTLANVPRDFFALPVFDLISLTNSAGTGDDALGIQITLLNASLIGLIDGNRNLLSVADVVNSLAQSFADDGNIEDNEALDEDDQGTASVSVIRLVDILSVALNQIDRLLDRAQNIVAVINQRLGNDNGLNLSDLRDRLRQNRGFSGRAITNNPNVQGFRVSLNGDFVVPTPSTTQTLGEAEVAVNTRSGRIFAAVNIDDVEIESATLRLAEAGINGDTILTLVASRFDDNRFVLPPASFLSDDQIDALLAGRIYIQVQGDEREGHNDDDGNDSLEDVSLRGQLTPANIVVIRELLDGDQEVPPVATNSSAIGYVTINTDTQDILSNVRTIDFIASVVHIHQGDAGLEGAIVIDMVQDATQPELWRSPASVNPVSDDFFNALLSAGTYFNAHSSVNPGGEVRGQISPDNFLVIRNVLDGDQEVPPVVTTSSGIGNLTINIDTREVRGNVRTVDFIASVVHIHQGDAGLEGAIVIDFEQDQGEPELWLLPEAASPVDDVLFAAILNGGTYFNAHSANNPGGEVRAQITPDNILVVRNVLDGDQEVPPVVTANSGIGNLTINTDTREIRGNVRTVDFIATLVHVHQGDAGVEGEVIIDFQQDVDEPELWLFPAIESPVSDERLAIILNGGTYFNAHSQANPGGEVRAQITPRGIVVIREVLDGDQEVPPVVTASSGIGNLTINTDTREVRGNVRTVDFIATLVHVHQGDAGVEGAVIIDFEQDQGEPELWFFPESASPVSEERLAVILNGGTYFNAHSSTNPGGEVRGQITPNGVVVIREVLDGDQEVPPVVTTNSGIGNLTVNINTREIRGNVRTVDFIATLVHVHQGDAGLEGAVIIDFEQDQAEPELWFFPEAASPVSQERLDVILNGGTYFNAHSAANPGGEVRAQITPANVIVIREVLDGAQEVPPVMTTNSAIGNVTLNGVTREIRGNVRTIGFTATMVHIHEGPAGAEGQVIIDFDQDQGDDSLWILPLSASPVSMDRLMTILNEGTYFNAHSTANPGGEVRGQLTPDEALSLKPLSSSGGSDGGSSHGSGHGSGGQHNHGS